MNVKIALAAVLLISGGSYVSHAQKSNIAQTATVSTAKAFESKISAYQKADATKSATLLSELTKEMTNGVGAAKNEMASAKDAETSEKSTKKLQTRMSSLNEVMQVSRADASNKTAIVAALKKYAQTL